MPSGRVQYATAAWLMCGIAGFIQKSPNPEALPRMLARIAHRGPDGEGVWDRAARRLAGRARPPAPVDHRRRRRNPADGERRRRRRASPTTARSTTSCACAPRWSAAGHQFRTRSDTEVILHHFEHYGVAGIPALDGMFAFAIWDARERRLTLARDRAGIKPLYYAELADGGIVFASELARCWRTAASTASCRSRASRRTSSRTTCTRR